MPKELVCILVQDAARYHELIDLINEHFQNCELYSTSDELVDRLKTFIPARHSFDDSILVVFSEYSQLPEVAGFMDQSFAPSGYLLAAFDDKPQNSLSDSTNLYDFIDISSPSFNWKFIAARLSKEIASKKRAALFQNEASRFYEIGKLLSTEKDTMRLFEMILDSSLEITRSDAGTIFIVVDRDSENWTYLRNRAYRNKRLKFVLSRNQSMDVKLETTVWPITPKSIAGYVLLSGNSLRIDDAYSEDNDARYIHDRSFDIRTGYYTKSMLTIPLKNHEGHVMGVIQLLNKKKSRSEKLNFGSGEAISGIMSYDYNDELVMDSLAGQAAISLENSLLYRDMNQLLQSYKEQNTHLEFLTKKILKAHEEERKRIAREIHDGPAQSIVNVSLKAELCKKVLQNGKAEMLPKELDAMISSARSTTKEIRTIIYDLKPSYLEDGIIKALENLLNVFSDNNGIGVSFKIKGSDNNIEYYLSSTIYRIVQEALSNIRKHAEADQVLVSLKITPESADIAISDNGKGFDVQSVESKKPARLEGGFGLEGIKERLELVRGSFDIMSSPGKGTHIRIHIPVPNISEADGQH